MSEKLIKGTSFGNPDVLPDTRDQAYQAKLNREQLAKHTLESAKVVDAKLKETKEPLVVDLGTSADGKVLSGSVERIQGDSGLMRVKILADGQPHASFAYPGLLRTGSTSRGGPAQHVMEERPDADGYGFEERYPNRSDPSRLNNLRDMNMQPGTYSEYGPQVVDRNAEDFVAAATVLSAAAAQIQQSQVETQAA